MKYNSLSALLKYTLYIPFVILPVFPPRCPVKAYITYILLIMPFLKAVPFILTSLLLLAACSSANKELFPEEESRRQIPVIVLSHGWHVGLLVPVDERFFEELPSEIHVSDGAHGYAELGWGDRRYYMEDRPGIFTTLRAALLPTSSAVHVAGFSSLPERRFEQQDAVKVMLTERGYQALLERAASYFRDGQASDIGPGLYGDARFYASGRRYYVPKTSNRWVAALLEEAGAPINSITSVSASTVIRRSARFGAPLPASSP